MAPIPETNHEFKLNVETANQIFKKCFDKAGVNGKRLRANILSAAIIAEFPDTLITPEFIRNKCGELERLMKGNEPNPKIGFGHLYLNPLALYAGIEDYKEFDKKFNRLVEVLCTRCPFKLFNLIRLVESGNISKTGTGWEFIDVNGGVSCGETLQLSIYTMPGDKLPFWLMVSFIDNKQPGSMYFAEMVDGIITMQSTDSRLYQFFSKK